MQIIAAISSPEHDEVLEKMLRHLKTWAPQWKRERTARGPPLQSARKHSPAEPIDPRGDMCNHAIDPPWVDEV